MYSLGSVQFDSTKRLIHLTGASNYNRMFVCGYVNVFLLDGLHLGRQNFQRLIYDPMNET